MPKFTQFNKRQKQNLNLGLSELSSRKHFAAVTLRVPQAGQELRDLGLASVVGCLAAHREPSQTM